MEQEGDGMSMVEDLKSGMARRVPLLGYDSKSVTNFLLHSIAKSLAVIADAVEEQKAEKERRET